MDKACKGSEIVSKKASNSASAAGEIAHLRVPLRQLTLEILTVDNGLPWFIVKA